MYNDFYLRTIDDPNYVPGVLTVQDEIENLVAQIKMTLLTSKGEVLGMPDFGFSAYDFLFDLNYVNTQSISQGAKEQIDKHCTLAANHTIDTEAQVIQLEKYRDAIGLAIDVDGGGGFGVLLA